MTPLGTAVFFQDFVERFGERAAVRAEVRPIVLGLSGYLLFV